MHAFDGCAELHISEKGNFSKIIAFLEPGQALLRPLDDDIYLSFLDEVEIVLLINTLMLKENIFIGNDHQFLK